MRLVRVQMGNQRVATRWNGVSGRQSANFTLTTHGADEWLVCQCLNVSAYVL